MDVYKKMDELGLQLPEVPPRGGMYSQSLEFREKLIYVSGCGPQNGVKRYEGKLGKELTVEEGRRASRDAMLNILAVLHKHTGDLNTIRPVKILTFVASTNEFYDQPEVANGGSELLAQLYGAENVPARSAIGLNVLPGNIPVETEALFEIVR